MKKQILVCLPLILLLISCHKDVSNSTNSSLQADVYVAGTEWNGSHEIAVYWKNGNRVVLGDGTSNSYAASIYVSGNDVYVCGAVEGPVPIATYWKNGTPVTLSDGVREAFATSIGVSGNDIYIAGFMGYYPSLHALYWKNSDAIYLSENADSAVSKAFSIFISGNDLYVAGAVTGTKVLPDLPDLVLQYTPAVYWKNGTPVPLTDGSKGDAANSIFVAGSNVYAAGGVDAQYWKNGQAVFLSLNEWNQVQANSIFVSGNDVYVAGTAMTKGVLYGPKPKQFAMYWKNGTRVDLSDLADSSQCNARSIFVFGNDVYVAGTKGEFGQGEDSRAIYWKNSNPVILSNNESYAYSIFIAQQ